MDPSRRQISRKGNLARPPPAIPLSPGGMTFGAIGNRVMAEMAGRFPGRPVFGRLNFFKHLNHHRSTPMGGSATILRGNAMEYGLCMFVTDYTIDIVTLAKTAERLGFKMLLVPEHPIIPVEMKTPFAGRSDGVLPEFYKHTIDPFVALAAAAAATETLRIGTGICLVPERNPLITAKEVASVDLISKGRFDFGIGAGWLRDESEIFGVDFPRRWAQTREYMMAMKACWGADPSEFSGKYVNFPKLWCHPKPVQKPHPPILMAGEGEKLAERMAEYGDEWLPRFRNITPETLTEGRKRIEDAMSGKGRDASKLKVNLFGATADKENNEKFFAAGADRIVLMMPSENEEKSVARLEQWAADLM